MHQALRDAEGLLSVQLPALTAAAKRTAERRSVASNAISAFLDGEIGELRDRATEPLIAAFGSMAREEMAPGSDFDYLVILNELETDPKRILAYREAATGALRAIGVQPPGSSGLFGVAVSGTEFVNTIGLETDTNLHLSRRVLLLEESVPLNTAESWSRLVHAIAARYLHEQDESRPRVPRFLLNDVVRYWRTLTVDYQAKRWQEIEGKKFGLRYVKLITARKLTFAAMVAALFAPLLEAEEATPDRLRQQFTQPALARLASLAPHIGDETRQALRRLLVAADEVVGLMADKRFRDAVEPVSVPQDAPRESEMGKAREVAEVIQTALEDLFLSAEPLATDSKSSLAALTRRYLIF